MTAVSIDAARILRNGVTPDDDVVLPPEFSEDALAERFSQLHPDWRYTAAWGRWSHWDGTVWRPDNVLQVFDLGRQVCRIEASRCENDRIAAKITSASTVASVERLARSDKRHAATIEQWDANDWALNTPAGIVDLTTGALRPSNRFDYCSKITAVAPTREGCPRWRSFLDRISGHNGDLQAFIQRMCGYTLTGSTRDHALFFLYGTGANGKTVFTSTTSGILGDYAKTSPIETFTSSVGEHHPTDLAGLQGARLVTAAETEEGRRWSESKLKSLTGGDRIAARFMRRDFFEFVPRFKLVIAGNHKPGLRTVDEAMRRRMNLLPFTVTIPAEERDSELPEKLKPEWPAILNWMIEGCVDWQLEGLCAPEVVRDATNRYLEAEDAIGRWIDDCCVTLPNCWSSTGALFDSWRKWSEQNHEHTGSQKRFSQNLESRGFSTERTRAARGFLGIGLREDV